jgi:hypothetical protein
MISMIFNNNVSFPSRMSSNLVSGAEMSNKTSKPIARSPRAHLWTRLKITTLNRLKICRQGQWASKGQIQQILFCGGFDDLAVIILASCVAKIEINFKLASVIFSSRHCSRVSLDTSQSPLGVEAPPSQPRQNDDLRLPILHQGSR